MCRVASGFRCDPAVILLFVTIYLFIAVRRSRSTGLQDTRSGRRCRSPDPIADKRDSEDSSGTTVMEDEDRTRLRRALGLRRRALGLRRRTRGLRRRALGLRWRARGLRRRALGLPWRAAGLRRQDAPVDLYLCFLNSSRRGVGRFSGRAADRYKFPVTHRMVQAGHLLALGRSSPRRVCIHIYINCLPVSSHRSAENLAACRRPRACPGPAPAGPGPARAGPGPAQVPPGPALAGPGRCKRALGLRRRAPGQRIEINQFNYNIVSSTPGSHYVWGDRRLAARTMRQPWHQRRRPRRAGLR